MILPSKQNWRILQDNMAVNRVSAEALAAHKQLGPSSSTSHEEKIGDSRRRRADLPQQSKKIHTLTVKLSVEDHLRIAQHSEFGHMSMSGWIRAAILEKLERDA
jgi:hypothetical protein